LDNNRIVVYKKNRKLSQSGGFYIIEISMNPTNNNLYIAAFDVSSPESLLIEL